MFIAADLYQRLIANRFVFIFFSFAPGTRNFVILMSNYGFTGREGREAGVEGECCPPSDYIKISRLKTDLQIRPGL